MAGREGALALVGSPQSLGSRQKLIDFSLAALPGRLESPLHKLPSARRDPLVGLTGESRRSNPAISYAVRDIFGATERSGPRAASRDVRKATFSHRNGIIRVWVVLASGALLAIERNVVVAARQPSIRMIH